MHPRWARGWIPFPRSAYDANETGGSPFWHEKRSLSRHEAWEYLWVHAAHGPHPWAIPGTSQVIQLDTGETPPLAIRKLMQIWGWKSKRKVEEFLFTLLDLGEIVKGQRTKFGDTYVFVGASVRSNQGAANGTETGRTRDADGTIDNKLRGKDNSPPTGESAERGNRLKPVKVRRTPLPMTDDWAPSADTVRLAEALHVNLAPFLLDFRGYWIDRGTRRADWDATCRARIEACASSGKFLLNGNGNGTHRPAQTDLLSTDAMKHLAEREAGEVPPYDPSQRWKTATK